MLVNLQKHATGEKLVVLSVNWRKDYREFLPIKRTFKNLGTEIMRTTSRQSRI